MRKRRLKNAIEDLLGMFFACRVSRSAAGLSYFLIMTVFPLLICLHYILGTLNLTDDSVFALLTGIIPNGVISVIGSYIEYVSHSASPTMLVAGLFVMMTSSSAAFRCIMHSMADIQGRPRFKGFFSVLVSFILSLAFLVVVYASALVVFGGTWLTGLLESTFGLKRIWDLWRSLRYVLLLVLMYAIVYSIYKLSEPKGSERVARIPGALTATLLLVGVSVVFSWFISMSVRITVVYGALASVIIMMIWLYVCGIIVIMGNALNIVIHRFRHTTMYLEGQ